MSALVRSEILGLFVNTLLLMASIPVTICRLSGSNFKRNYLKNKRGFLDFVLHFTNLHQIQKILKKKMSLLACLSPELLTVKKMVI